MQNVVTYFRVSTKRQGASGLGLEGQQSAVNEFVSREGATVVREYVEVETGTSKRHRPELAKALAHAKRAKATLVVAKLDRLARNVAFTSALLESGVDFVAVDNPTANKLTIHILAAVAENEAEAISQRTKAALEVAKQRGVKLGSAREGHWAGIEDKRQAGLVKAQKAASEARRKQADDAYADIAPLVQEWREAGKTLQQIATELNEQGFQTRRGRPWNATQVSRVLKRTN